MAEPAANYVFLPWVRQGAASGIQTTDMTANQSAVVSVKAQLRINNVPEVERQIQLYGPGDVIGIDPQQVVRTEPRHLATDFEPNYFPAIEFDRPDFPWMFTPAKADAANRLRPWLCLIVVRKQEGVTIRVDQNLPLPVLEIKAPARPARELPDLSESWAWAHAQIAGTQIDTASLASALTANPALTVSRLVCPRRLDPLTNYIACVVPAFEQGRRAGLGEPGQRANEESPIALAPAWVVNVKPPAEPPDQVVLPVYFQWEFRTGVGGDFESLVGLLQAREMPDNVGKRPIDISEPGFPLPADLDPKGTRLFVAGALRVVGDKSEEWLGSVRVPFQTALLKILNRAWEIATKKADNHDPIVGPPIYGCWQAARHEVNLISPPPLNWLDELNLDPRHRVVAAFGTQVVQSQQEDLMASAWEQLGQIQRVNQIRRQAQFGREVNAVYHGRHFSRFSEETLLKILAPAQSRIVVEPTSSSDRRAFLSTKISRSTLPSHAVSAPLRRLTNSRGVLSHRFVTAGTPATATTTSFMARLAVTSVATTSMTSLVNRINLVAINNVSRDAGSLKEIVTYERVLRSIDTAPKLVDFKIASENITPKRNLLNFKPGTDSTDAAMFRKVVKAHHEHLAKLFAPDDKPAEPRLTLLTAQVKTSLLRSLDPERTISSRVLASLTSTGDNKPSDDPLEPVIDEPNFPQPMYEALRDLSQDFLLPGLDQVPANTVALLETNPKFVESFLVGLNAEMSSELLWRNFPTTQRGTYFKQFWDTAGGSADEDIEAIADWNGRHLGDNSPQSSGKLVLLLRGELLRRYPTAVIYAVRATRTRGQLDVSRDAKDERHPIFRGTLRPDVTFVGFNLSEAEALGKPPNHPDGWFFVIQQQPTEPAFGLDVADFAEPQAPALTTWSDLSWRHFANTEEELKELSHVSLSKAFPQIDQVSWGKNSAHQAFITLQRPVRIAIHAKQMIRETTDANPQP
jgi:hypothetical protein